MLRRIGAVVVAGLAATTLLVGCSAEPASPPRSTPTSQHETTAAAVDPAEVDIPKIDATSTLVGLGLNDDQTVQVPPVEEPMQAGWFTGAPRPGEAGPAVILGHVNGGGHAGIFARLHELADGDEVRVKRVDGSTLTFTVTRVDQVPKDAFPTDEVYGNTEGPELRLITCGGDFDRSAHSYEDNIIVYAKLA
jgi:LPXTG-site transpeptidase (sortase) family protein